MADRRLAKAVNFGPLYGQGADGLRRYARARAVGTIARAALDAIEADRVVARVTAIEAVLARRNPA